MKRNDKNSVEKLAYNTRRLLGVLSNVTVSMPFRSQSDRQSVEALVRRGLVSRISNGKFHVYKATAAGRKAWDRWLKKEKEAVQ